MGLSDGLAGGIVGALGVVLLLGLAITIFSIAIIWRLFTKAGEEGWKCLIPFYSTYIMIKIAFGRNKGWVLGILLITPLIMLFLEGEGTMFYLMYLINLALSTYVSFNFYRRFASVGLAIGAVLMPIIFAAVIAFGNYSYAPAIVYNNTSNDNPHGYL